MCLILLIHDELFFIIICSLIIGILDFCGLLVKWVLDGFNFDYL